MKSTGSFRRLWTVGALAGIALVAPSTASAFSSGSGTCIASASSASPMGMPVAGNGGYALTLAGSAPVPPNQYLPGSSASLSLTGMTPFKGVLIYAEDAQGNRVGGFTSFNLTNFQLRSGCAGGTDSTLTHQSALLKTLPQTFTWRAPPGNIGPLVFRAIVLRGFNDYYVIQSPAIEPFADVVFGSGFEP